MKKGRDLQVLASQMDFMIVLEQYVLVLIDGGGCQGNNQTDYLRMK